MINAVYDWAKVSDLNRTILINDSAFSEYVYTIHEAYLSYQQNKPLALFEEAGKYYIVALSDTAISFNGAHSKAYIVGNDMILSSGGGRRNWIKLSNVIYQYGSYVLQGDQFVAEVESGSQTIPSIPVDFDDNFQPWTSNTLTGTYTSEDDARSDIVVGWHYFTHEELDSDGVPTGGTVDVYQGDTLYDVSGSNRSWRYNYNGVLYSYSGALEQENINMSSSQGSLQLVYQDLVTRKSSVIKFDGGISSVD